jgi:hypothetical protein
MGESDRIHVGQWYLEREGLAYVVIYNRSNIYTISNLKKISQAWLSSV